MKQRFCWQTERQQAHTDAPKHLWTENDSRFSGTYQVGTNTATSVRPTNLSHQQRILQVTKQICLFGKYRLCWNAQHVLSLKMNRDNVTLVYLVKEILHQVCNANVVKMAMSKQKFLEVLEFGDGIIAVPHCLPALFTLNAWNTKNKCHTHHQVYPPFGFRTTVSYQCQHELPESCWHRWHHPQWTGWSDSF